jgi:L-ascorbate metabolism protein UlaG (beta-lactamase superfamily)
MSLRLTRWGHSCVRLERDGHVVVIDPGAFPDTARALGGADEVLVTHLHPDHVDPAVLAPLTRSGLRVLGPPAVVDALREAGADEAALQGVHDGDTLRLGPFSVQVAGAEHEVIHPDVPRIANVAYLVDGVYHPGDSFTPAPGPVEVLLLPVGAPWLALRDAVDFGRRVGAPRVVPVHDAVLSDAGLAVAQRLVGSLVPGELVPLAMGDGIDVPGHDASVEVPSHEVPVLEADETVPPRPEEEIADVARAVPDPEGHGA